MISSVVGEVMSALEKVSGLSGDLLAQVTAALASVNAGSGTVLPTVTPDVRNFLPLVTPLPTVAREGKAQPSNGFKEITTVLPIVTVVSDVPTIEWLVPERPANMPVNDNHPGLLDGADAGGLKVKRRGVIKEEG
jgi:hypothetical protein